MYCEYCGSVLHEGRHTKEWRQSWNVGGELIRCRLYRVWCSMRNRCRNPGNQKWSRYGARGIRVCGEWQSFANFRNWSVAHGYGPDLSIDRIDNDGNYEPSNCRWIPLPENKAKLTPDDVRAIRKAEGTPTEIGRRFGVNSTHVTRIKTREQRANVPD